ncbi:hypothetical protein [Blastococcus goldschmidtiae]|uniref:Ankyrin repeat domain-containing protein n=1 Tax=Blastococcus goldschmidtiae TaxID=3075546 RepID=A0ABU2K565_9ACTN|nr:hypothetical protein [Blastococcus sp. DSM 46792]MDT0275315.1 hypothetical protein [Blastococcus sp. DSM 46792]
MFKQAEGGIRHLLAAGCWLLAAGADPDRGDQTARDTARFFGLTAMTELLDAPR